MTKSTVLLVALVVFASGLHIKMQHQALLADGPVTLKADIGTYLARCTSCGSTQGTGADAATVQETNSDFSNATWTLVSVGDQIALKADNGKYLQLCMNCWTKSNKAESAFATGTSPSGASLWTPEKLANGKWALKGDNGKYLARCYDCVTYRNTVFVHSTTPSTNNYAQWVINYRFPTGNVNLQADFCPYLARCNNCPQNAADSATIDELNPTASRAIWSVERVGSQVALKSDNGKYLSKCTNCWVGASNPDSAFANGESASGSSLWTPEYLNNGKWALKGDNGKYLSRCLNCGNDSNYPNLAFVHIDNPTSSPYAQWTVSTR